MKCERDKQDDGTLRQGGCADESTESVELFDGDAYHFCAACAAEARRLNGVLRMIADGDSEGKRLSEWLAEADSRAEYDRRISTLPEAR